MLWRFRTASELKDLLGEDWHQKAQMIRNDWNQYFTTSAGICNTSLWNEDIDSLLGTFPEQPIQTCIAQRVTGTGQHYLSIDLTKVDDPNGVLSVDISVLLTQDVKRSTKLRNEEDLKTRLGNLR